jgi:hypothetical protein
MPPPLPNQPWGGLYQHDSRQGCSVATSRLARGQVQGTQEQHHDSILFRHHDSILWGGPVVATITALRPPSRVRVKVKARCAAPAHTTPQPHTAVASYGTPFLR